MSAGQTDKPFVISRDFDAPRDLVWKSWTEPERLKHWWGPKGFVVHTCKVDLRPGGRFHYGLKQGLSQMLLTADTLAGEANTIQVKDLGSHTNAITIKGARDRHFNLVVHHKLGAGRDYLRMTIDRIPLAAGGELTINVKPGIGGVELLSAGQKIETNVAFEYVRQGAELRSTFALKEEHGMRVVPSTFITGNVLKVSASGVGPGPRLCRQRSPRPARG